MPYVRVEKLSSRVSVIQHGLSYNEKLTTRIKEFCKITGKTTIKEKEEDYNECSQGKSFNLTQLKHFVQLKSLCIVQHKHIIKVKFFNRNECQGKVVL